MNSEVIQDILIHINTCSGKTYDNSVTDVLNLLIPKIQEWTIDYNLSHDWKHFVAVLKNAITIMYSEEFSGQELDIIIIIYAALLHDVCDYKYEMLWKITPRDLRAFIVDNIGEYKAAMVTEIIDNISCSKERRGRRLSVHEPYLSIVSDADKIEALGKSGIGRCFAHKLWRNETTSNNIMVRNEVLNVCKIHLQFLKDKYIRTIKGKQMAEQPHQEIIDYIAAQTN